VLADGRRLKQVFLNLLSNAVKYNRSGGTVTVECWPTQAAPTRALRICVKDTGFGLSAEKIARLFTPFDRLGAEQTGVEGTGLGLAYSKRMVTAMGGTLGMESMIGTGSSFWVDLPLVESSSHGTNELRANQATHRDPPNNCTTIQLHPSELTNPLTSSS
jgi:signal transduction histidine kinase